ncbi:type IV-A pilus assembly ATPase PilB [Pseudoalteromonas spongiae]|uniref:type IV-A pilus assembly ATPase PilB n=1 Tax=Pseudoalteromonas spongiae TaxID=298657 RepID=UPI00110B1728|nr:type IV-A pilus assembly ATPase PilB [Pseudoalteromonas spongiae]TMO85351.1 type IV-A pilus assembly ATPase PilB [Pseudoalteromonas spongiae]
MNVNSPLIRKCVAMGFIAHEQVSSSANASAHTCEFILNNSKLSSKQLAAHCSSWFNLPTLNIAKVDPSSIPLDNISEELVKKHHLLPLSKRGRTLFLATSDPTNFDAFEDFEFNTGLQTEAIVVDFNGLEQFIESIFSKTDNLELTDDEFEQFGDIEVQESSANLSDAAQEDKDDAPIIVYINKILMDAIRKGASDLHFEPYEKTYRIRFRIDGILHEVASPPQMLSSRISARVKVMSQLDIAEKRKPQDGRIKLKITAKKSIDFRVSTLPTLWGEKIVMRILDSSSAMLGIDVLGYEPAQKAMYLDALSQPQGMILVTGPTGSGKTVSLYTGLNILNKAEVNISTAEDPVEINLVGVNQVQINPRADMTFANALRAFLRQDPDIVMVGEIRDLETAEIAIKAAQTGHLVLSTLHTNSAPETLTRLLNMGVPAYNVASSISLIIAQRLARRLCNNCKTPETLPIEELKSQGFSDEQIGNITLFKAVGCEHCTEGYKGRVGIYEVMRITSEISQIIMSGGNSLDIAKASLASGFNSLRLSGLEKAASGVTSLAEINRVTSY